MLVAPLCLIGLVGLGAAMFEFHPLFDSGFGRSLRLKLGDAGARSAIIAFGVFLLVLGYAAIAAHSGVTLTKRMKADARRIAQRPDPRRPVRVEPDRQPNEVVRPDQISVDESPVDIDTTKAAQARIRRSHLQLWPIATYAGNIYATCDIGVCRGIQKSTSVRMAKS